MAVQGPAGGSTYSSNTMYVGDGTWIADHNTFLLPNLQGLNFATMQYNGMGNRFRDLPEYHVLITGHGVLAAIVFLGTLPAAIFLARFYNAGARALKLHIYLQIINVFLLTVVFILGNLAVGPKRALSNPHHGIGVAIYVSFLVNFIYAWWMKRREGKRSGYPPKIPLKVHLHKLFGRAIALLGFVQIALGLTLYGSPKVLFILYALWGAVLIFWYLTLEYMQKPLSGAGGRASRSDRYTEYTGSYLSGDRTELTQHGHRRDESRDKNHWGTKLLAGAGLFGAYEWYKGRRNKRSDEDEKDDRYNEEDRRHRPQQSEMSGPPQQRIQNQGYSQGQGYGQSQGQGYGQSQGQGYGQSQGQPGGSQAGGYRRGQSAVSRQSWEHDDENDNDNHKPQRQSQSGTWRDRILGAGAGIAAFEGVKSMFGSRRRRNEGYMDSQVSYDQPSQTDVSRVEAGQAPSSPDNGHNNTGRRAHFDDAPTPMTPTRPPPRRRPSAGSMSYEDDASYATPSHQHNDESHTLRDSIASMGAVAGFREWNKRRKERKENEKFDRIRRQEIDNEEKEFNRRNSQNYPRAQDANGRHQSADDTVMTGPTGGDPAFASNANLSRQNVRPDISQPPLPAFAGTLPNSGGPPTSMEAGASGQYQNPEVPSGQYPDRGGPSGQYQNTGGQLGQYPSQGGPSGQYSNPMNLNVTQHQALHQMPYNLPPPPPGPPPNMAFPSGFQQQQQGPMQMPQGFVVPDPSRLVQGQTQRQTADHFQQNGQARATTELDAGAGASAGSQTLSPSRGQDSRTRLHSSGRGSSAAASGSQLNNDGMGSSGSPPVSVKVNMHPDGRHVTLRRLNEDEAAAERANRRRDRKARRASSLSSGGEETGRYRRPGVIRPSNEQPITNIPLPPTMSSSAGASQRRPSELNLPPTPPMPPGHQAPPLPQASSSPQGTPSGLLPAMGPAGSGQVGSPGAVPGTGTDLSSQYADNRKRRRAERARRLEAARGNNRVEFS